MPLRHSASHPASGESATVTANAADSTDRSVDASGTRGDTIGTRPRRPMLDAGAIVDRYEIVGLLGSGGMSVVYAAYDPKLGRRIALKLLRPERGGSSANARLLREAHAMASLSHPNVVAVHDMGVVGDDVFIAMELVRGRTLGHWLSHERPDWRGVLAAFTAAGRGLAAAHTSGLVHRDFKPENVLLGDDGIVRVTDFGLARAFDDAADDTPRTSSQGDAIGVPLTVTGDVLGTPLYMAPEQHAGGSIGPAADQFAFACAFYEALYGVRPFAGRGATELRVAKEQGELVTPSRPLRRGVPRWLHRLVVRGLAAAPGRRHPSMAAILAELERDRGRARRIGTVAVAVAAAALVPFAVASSMRSDEAARCRAAAGRSERAWNPALAERIRGAFASSGIPDSAGGFERLAAALTAAREAWAAVRIDVCEATHVRREQPAPLLDLRVHCLDRRLDELAALGELFAGTAEPTVLAGAVDAVARVEPAASCRDLEPLTDAPPRPTGPAAIAELVALEAELAPAKAAEHAGRPAEALAIIARLLPRARALGYPPLLAEVLWLHAILLGHQGDPGAALEAGYDALAAAAAAGDDLLGANIAIALLHNATLHVRHAEARAFDRIAEAAIGRVRGPAAVRDSLRFQFLVQRGMLRRELGDRAGARTALDQALALSDPERDGPLRVAVLWNDLGELYGDQLDWPAAQHAYERGLALARAAGGPKHLTALEIETNLGFAQFQQGDIASAQKTWEGLVPLYEQVIGPDQPAIATVLLNLAGVKSHLGRNAEAAALLRRAAAVEERAYGRDHPTLMSTLRNLAEVERLLGNRDAARALLDRTLAVDLATYGEEHEATVDDRRTLGAVLADRRDFVAARSELERALATAKKIFDAGHPTIAELEGDLGYVTGQQGDCAAASRHFEVQLALREKTFGPAHHELVYPLLNLGHCTAKRGDRDGALGWLERAVAIADGGAADASVAAEARFELAKVLWSAGRDRDRALALALKARSELSGIEGQTDRAEVEAWLAKRGR